MTQPTNQPTGNEGRTQSKEDAINRMAGVPKTPDELEHDREVLDQERIEEAQRRAGVYNPNGPAEPGRGQAQHSGNTPDSVQQQKQHDREQAQREKA